MAGRRGAGAGRTTRHAGHSRPKPGAVSRGRAYRDLEDYGIIGDLHTAALVAVDGSIDWFCTPHFDSPSVFGRLLDARKGGHFAIQARGATAHRQMYLPDTNVLLTRAVSPQGIAETLDFMPFDQDPDTPPLHRIVRRVRALRGPLEFDLVCRPAFDHGRAPHKVRARRGGVRFQGPGLGLELQSSVPLRIVGRAAKTRFRLGTDEEATFVLWTEPPKGKGGPPRPAGEDLDPDVQFRRTVKAWRTWMQSCTYRGRWQEAVHRSALVLKLMTHEPTGAIIAAPTSSLPESIGGRRNWDYRYAWVRDASFIVHSLLGIGFVHEARHFTGWLLDRVDPRATGDPLLPLYTIDGKRPAPEAELRHLDGYRASRPVRIGNAAVDHLQLDIYGALLEAAHRYEKAGPFLSNDLWMRLAHVLDWLCANWERPDRGIWETRAEPQHHTFSKMMCWVALDRGIRLAAGRGLPGDVPRWTGERDRIHAAVMQRGWNPRRGSFVQVFDGDRLDASLLLMPLVGFIAPRDPRMLGTIEAIRRELGQGHLVRRYLTDEGDAWGWGAEGSFNLCGFWLASAMARAGQVDDARFLFETLLGFANPLGLMAEQVNDSGQALGNYPQGLTHLALIQAALDLDQALGDP